jgi:hypothetical protein
METIVTWEPDPFFVSAITFDLSCISTCLPIGFTLGTVTKASDTYDYNGQDLANQYDACAVWNRTTVSHQASAADVCVGTRNTIKLFSYVC